MICKTFWLSTTLTSPTQRNAVAKSLRWRFWKPQEPRKHRRHALNWIWKMWIFWFLKFQKIIFGNFKISSDFLIRFPDLVDPDDLDFTASSHRELHRWWEIRVGTRMNAAKPFNMSAETPWHRIWAPESEGTRPIQPLLHRLQSLRYMQEIRHDSGVALWGKAPGGAMITKWLFVPRK